LIEDVSKFKSLPAIFRRLFPLRLLLSGYPGVTNKKSKAWEVVPPEVEILLFFIILFLELE
jgi:hypothetical protein